jgi:predicted metalloprotease with PDZ domain
MSSRKQTAAVHYRIDASNVHAHLFEITLTIAQPHAQQQVSMPAWIPGSYLIREFGRHVQQLRATQGRRTRTVTQLDKATWSIEADADQPLTLRYAVYAFDTSVRAAWLDARRGFFNGTGVCLRVHGHEQQPHQLQLLPVKGHADWQVATGLTAVDTNRQGFGLYAAHDYDELVDCPVEMGTFWSGRFKACGMEHRFVVAGAPTSFDGTRLLADTQKICETAIAFWHGKATHKAPHKNYVFMLNATDDGYGGLEHRNSTALICNRRDLPRVTDTTNSASGTTPREGYVTLLGLISHEYFHTWNVKRLRPDAFARYDYTQENYTELLWFFEGFTSYYDDLLLLRAGLISETTYIRLLGKTIQTVQQMPGRQVQSVAQASFDAWVKYYRVDENTPNATVSYYAKGALVAACLDLTLRQEGHSLDALMRLLWQRCHAGPMREQDVLDALQALTGRSYKRELQAWVHGTDELPLARLLPTHGVTIHTESASFAQRLGVRAVDAAGGVQIKTVLRHSAAEHAGLAANDEWLGLEVDTPTRQAWRIQKLDDVPMLLGRAREGTMLVARDRQLLRLKFKLPPAASVWRLEAATDHAPSTASNKTKLAKASPKHKASKRWPVA